MFKRLLKKLVFKAYQMGKFEADRLEKAAHGKSLFNSAIVGQGTVIDPQAVLQNSLLDRKRISIGSNCLVKGYLVIFGHGGSISIGDDCFIGPDSKIWSSASITIGNRVLISHNVNIHDNNSHPLNSKERHEDFVHIFRKGFREINNLGEKSVIIEDDVWIGFNATILKGVTIGRGAIIGACTVITQDIPAYAIVVGNPARIVRYGD